MLSGDAGAALENAELAARALDADWSGFMINDLNGNIMVADVEGTGRADLLATSVSLFDIAISPSGRLVGIGGPVDGTSILYELNVDFDNPGGLIDPVQIGFVATNNNGVRLNGLEYTADGTLLATGYDYPDFPRDNYLYSIDENTAVATRLVNLGFHQSAGDVTSDEEGAAYVVTLAGDLLRIPSDYSGFSVVGNVGFADVYGMTYGPGPELRGYRTNGDVLNINPVDATWVGEITLWPDASVSAPGSLLGATTIADPPTDLGEVDFVELADQSPVLEELWYRFDTMHDGFVTVELDDLSATGGIDLTLHRAEADGTLQEVASGNTRVDYESAEAGDRYFVEVTGIHSDATVRIVNQVEPGTDTLVVHGSGESDALELEVGTPYLVTINGVDYEIPFPGAPLVTTTFDGGEGGDSIRVLGGDGDDTAEIDLGALSGTADGPGFLVNFSSTAVMEFDGQGGKDSAAIQGTDADSQLNLEPFQGEVVEGVIRGTVLHAEQISIDAAGGDDHANFEGGIGGDRLDLNPTSGMYRDHVLPGEVRDPEYTISATNIESNSARGGGGVDAILMRDSPGDEQFTVALGHVTYEGPGYSHEASGFRHVHAYGLNGGFDQATFYDTQYDDKFKGKVTFANLRGGQFYFRAKGFEDVEANAIYGGNDLAVFFDTGGDDLFTSSYETATMSGSGLTRTANGFTRILARSYDGYDVARLQDSPGRDVIRSRNHKSVFWSLDDDALDVTVRAFDEVLAESVHGGDDIAKMHDTFLDEHFTGSGDTGRLYRNEGGGLDLLYEAVGFQYVKAYWTSGTDTKDLVPPLDFTYLEVFL